MNTYLLFFKIVTELTDILLDYCIEDPAGRDFWRKIDHGETEIEWATFSHDLKTEIQESYTQQFEELSPNPSDTELMEASDYQLNSFAARGMSQQRRVEKEAKRRYNSVEIIFNTTDNLDQEIACLKHLLRVDENRGKVMLKHWGDVLRWFGPMTDDNGFPTFLLRVCL